MQTFQQYLAEQISRHLSLKGVDRYGLQQTLWKEDLHPRVGEGKEGGGRFAPKNAPDGAPSLPTNAGATGGNAAQGNGPSQHLGQPVGGVGHLNQPQQQAQGQLPLGGMGGPPQPQAPPLPAPLMLAAQKREEILNKHFPQRQGGLFDAGRGDLMGQQSLFQDIGIQGQPAPQPQQAVPANTAPPQAPTTPAPSPVTTPAEPPRRRMMGGSADSMKAQAQTAAPAKPMTVAKPEPPAPVQAVNQPDITSRQEKAKAIIGAILYRQSHNPLVADQVNQINTLMANGDAITAMDVALEIAKEYEYPDLVQGWAQRANEIRGTKQTDPPRAETVPQPPAALPGVLVQQAAAEDTPAPTGQMDERAFNDMLAGNERYILALAKKHAAGTTSDPEDIAQETMMDAWQNRNQFQGSNPEDFKKWIATKVHGKFVDATRKATAKKRGMGQTRSLDAPMGDDGTATLGDTIQGASNDNAQNMMIEELHKALATLDPHLQDAVKGMFFGGKSTRELAPELGVSHETVSQRSKGAIAALEGKLNYARSRNPELFDYVDAEVDRYCRHYTLLPAKERYGSLTGNSLMGHLIRGLLTAMVFGLVNGGSGQSQASPQASTGSQASSSLRSASPVKPSAPAPQKPSVKPVALGSGSMLQPEQMPQTQTPTGWGDWLGDDHDTPNAEGDKTVPMPPMAQTQVGGTTAMPQAPDAPSEEDMAKADAMVDEAPDNDLSFMHNPAHEARQAEQSPSGQQGSLWPDWNDKSHPRHRKGDPQGRGGQFAPKNEGTTDGGEAPAAQEQKQPTAKPQSFGGTKRNWMTGGGTGSVEFADQEHADMHELGSKMGNHMRGKGNTKGAKGVTSQEKQRVDAMANHYAEKHGVSPEEIKSHALATARATREQAKGIGDGEHRKLNYTPFKKDTGNGSPTADTGAGDAGNAPEQPGLPQEPQAPQEPMAAPETQPAGDGQLPADANDGGLGGDDDDEPELDWDTIVGIAERNNELEPEDLIAAVEKADPSKLNDRRFFNKIARQLRHENYELENRYDTVLYHRNIAEVARKHGVAPAELSDYLVQQLGEGGLTKEEGRYPRNDLLDDMNFLNQHAATLAARNRIPKRHRQAVDDIAKQHGVDPGELYQYAQDNIAAMRGHHEQTEATKQALRQSTGWNAGHVGKMENSGFDAGGERSGNKRLDELAMEHGLESDEQAWSMLREGAKSLPKLGDRNYLSQMAMDLAYRKQNEQAANPAEFYREAFVDDFGQTVPFSRPRRTGSVDRRQWSMDSGSLVALATLPNRR